jgi:DNA or RNA helicases of superfamily II
MTLFESNTDKPKFTLRSNQIPAVEKGISFLKSKSIRPSIIVAPTAYGKSIVIASIAKEIDGRTIILQPSKELLEQNYNKLIALGGQACIYSASMKPKK